VYVSAWSSVTQIVCNCLIYERSFSYNRRAMHPSNKMRPIFKLGVIFASFALGFALLETTLRLFPHTAQKKDWFDTTVSDELLEKKWYQEWKDDHSHLKRNFQAYEIYHTAAHSGKHINITKDGYRRTLNKSWPQGVSPSRIGIFGGSQMWGSGARDSFTASSRLSGYLNETFPQLPLEVVNYSEVGYVFSQSLHRAIRVLYSDAELDSPAPRIMTFFSVNNDVLAGLDNFSRGVDEPAGLPWEYERFQYLFRLGDTCEVSTMDVFKKFKVVRTGIRAMANLGWIKPEKKGFWREPTEQQWKLIGRQVAQKYIKQVSVADKTLKGAGVTPVFVLPPILTGKFNLTRSESDIMARNEKILPYLRYTYDQIHQERANLESDVILLNWNSLFATETENIFYDIFHYNEAGHDKIAKALSHVLGPTIMKWKEDESLSIAG